MAFIKCNNYTCTIQYTTNANTFLYVCMFAALSLFRFSFISGWQGQNVISIRNIWKGSQRVWCVFYPCVTLPFKGILTRATQKYNCCGVGITTFLKDILPFFLKDRLQVLGHLQGSRILQPLLLVTTQSIPLHTTTRCFKVKAA